MSGVSAIFILNNKGVAILQRFYRYDIPIDTAENFNKILIEQEDSEIPIIYDQKTNITYIYKNYQNITLLAVTKKNTNSLMIISFLYQLIDLFVFYFKELEEESVRDNFVVIYELLDEIMDNGIPQNTDYKILADFIKMESHQLFKKQQPQQIDPNLSKFATLSTSAVAWRKEGISYKKNELYLDVIEKLNMLISKSGGVLEAEIIGSVMVNSMLSGFPECHLCINDKEYFEQQENSVGKTICFEDLKFHQCVRLSTFQNERAITFIPPDGEFELISYRVPVSIGALFSVDVIFKQPSNSKIDIMIKAKSNFKEKSTAHDVHIYIPVPDDAQKPQFETVFGKSSWASEKECIKWSFNTFEGLKEYVMSSSFQLPSIPSPSRESYKTKPIQIEFEIPFFTVTGFQVKYMKVQEKSGYKASTWVRYLTKNSMYQIRMK